MSRIRSISQLEVDVRDYLEDQGYKIELHSPDIIGHPDIVIRDRDAIVLVHGCFFHRHRDCRLAYPVSAELREKKLWWGDKFTRQVARDQYVLKELLHAGWRVIIAWECAVSKQKAPNDLRRRSLEALVTWLESDEKFAEIRRPTDVA